jgi:hypothetical protein
MTRSLVKVSNVMRIMIHCFFPFRFCKHSARSIADCARKFRGPSVSWAANHASHAARTDAKLRFENVGGGVCVSQGDNSCCFKVDMSLLAILLFFLSNNQLTLF